MTSYEIKEHKGQGFSMRHGRVGDTVRFDVVFGDRRVWSSNEYFVNSCTKRQVGGLRLQAANMRKRYQSHLDRTGSRFELEQDIERGKGRYEKAMKECVSRVERACAHLAMEHVMGRAKQSNVLTYARSQCIHTLDHWRNNQREYWKEIEAYCESVKIDFLTKLMSHFNGADRA